MKRNNTSLGTIVGGMSRLKKVGQTFNLTRQEDVFKSKVYGLDYVLNQNVASVRNGQIIDIDPKETFEKVEGTRQGNYKKVLDALKKEARNTKRSLKMPLDESYIEAREDGADIPKNDYLQWLEETIINMTGFDTSSCIDEVEIIEETSQEDIEKEALKAEYLEVFGKKAGNKSVETMKKLIEDAKENQ